MLTLDQKAHMFGPDKYFQSNFFVRILPRVMNGCNFGERPKNNQLDFLSNRLTN
jgi:hypothetical protein